MAVEAVIWDFGGVFTSSPFEAFNRYERERGLPVDFLRSVNAVNPLDNAWARLERSECTREAFDAMFAAESQALGHRVPGADAHRGCRQIAGALARRICTYPRPGDAVVQGSELGFIKFGSRVDLFLPLNARVAVRVGDTVQGAVTSIASMP